MFSKSSEVQLSNRQRRMWQLLLAWLFTYFLVGIAFALTYHGLAPLIGCTVKPFFAQKSYGISSIRCGAFKGINNHEVFRLKNRNEQESHLKAVLNLTIPTSPDDCRRCPYHADCVFDVAQATRNAPERRASADPAIDPEMST